MARQKLETPYATYWIEDGIVNMLYPRNLIITMEIAKEIVENRLKVTGNIKMPLLADIRGLASIDMAARRYFASADAVGYLSAGAFVVDSLVSRLAGNIFIRVDKPLVPTRLFTNVKKAEMWLSHYK